MGTLTRSSGASAEKKPAGTRRAVRAAAATPTKATKRTRKTPPAPAKVTVKPARTKVLSAPLTPSLGLRREPNKTSLDAASTVGKLRLADCAIRHAFARRDAATDPPPTLAQLVGKGTGRAAEVRVKLVLTLLFLASKDNDGTWTVGGKPGSAWAKLFGLEQPGDAGAERVGRSIRRLHNEKLIFADAAQGREPRLVVCHETGNHKKWTSPVAEESGRGTVAKPDLYFQLDRGFWTNGWITVLSARAVTALLIVLDATWNRKPNYEKQTLIGENGKEFDQTIWLDWYYFAESELQDRYGLSRDMFDRGIAELIQWRLVEKQSKPKKPKTAWDGDKWFREVRVRLEVLRFPAAAVYAGKEPVKIHSSKSLEAAIETLDSKYDVDKILEDWKKEQDAKAREQDALRAKFGHVPDSPTSKPVKKAAKKRTKAKTAT